MPFVNTDLFEFSAGVSVLNSNANEFELRTIRIWRFMKDFSGCHAEK